MSAPVVDLKELDALFFAYATERVATAKRDNRRFVYYTAADTAIKIIKNRELWMRSAAVMNDYSEIAFGWSCLVAALHSGGRDQLTRTIDGVHPGLTEAVLQRLDAAKAALFEATYLTCFSEHDDDEDELGRLSTWRAYGGGAGVALVFNGTALLSESNALNVFTSPVIYGVHPFEHEFQKFIARIRSATDVLRKYSRELILRMLYNMLRFAVLSTKHFAFREEREWRLLYLPAEMPSQRLTCSVQTIRGTPQVTYQIPLKDVPEEGFVGADLREGLSRIIIGPCKHPRETVHAIHQTLAEVDGDDLADRIFDSKVPLRIDS